jgi:hypothetical protein
VPKFKKPWFQGFGEFWYKVLVQNAVWSSGILQFALFSKGD